MTRHWFVTAALLLPSVAAAQRCGDDSCDAPVENQCNCPRDCGADPSDGCCLVTGLGGDNCNNDPECACPPLPGTCTSVGGGAFYCQGGCRDGVCDRRSGESFCNCPSSLPAPATGDCDPACGDGCCTAQENANTCPEDCLPECGNGVCEEDEDDCTCPDDDCGATCGDGRCCAAGGEDPSNCNTAEGGDCSDDCGDGLCTGSEGCDDCLTDCECRRGDQCDTDVEPAVCVPPCGDDTCDERESCDSCPADCGACPDGGPGGDGGGGPGSQEEGTQGEGPENLYACDCSLGDAPVVPMPALLFLALGLMLRRLGR